MQFEKYPNSSSSEQRSNRFAQSVPRDIERALLDFERVVWGDSQRVENRCVKVFNDYSILDRLAGAFVGSYSVKLPFLDATAEKEDRTGVSEVAMHAIIL